MPIPVGNVGLSAKSKRYLDRIRKKEDWTMKRTVEEALAVFYVQWAGKKGGQKGRAEEKRENDNNHT